MPRPRQKGRPPPALLRVAVEERGHEELNASVPTGDIVTGAATAARGWRATDSPSPFSRSSPAHSLTGGVLASDNRCHQRYEKEAQKGTGAAHRDGGAGGASARWWNQGRNLP